MHFPQAIYGWLVSIGIISNTGTKALTQDSKTNEET
jgi:hypothetical protein